MMIHRVNSCRSMFVILLFLPSFVMAKDKQEAIPVDTTFSHSFAKYAIQAIRNSHTPQNPVIVEQSELDQLIHPDGGGACPISAALIAMQAVRAMSDVPLEEHPHRFALRVFQQKPELKEGRISNDRFVSLLKLTSGDLGKVSVDVEVVSAPNSCHTSSGPYWDGKAGPDLETSPGELKILSYTHTTSAKKVIGRHFVLLRTIEGRQLRVLDPKRPFKDYQYALEYSDGPAANKRRVFFDSLASNDEKDPTFELNTIFSIRLKPPSTGKCLAERQTLSQVKSKIDTLAAALKKEGKLTSPAEWRRRSAKFGLPGLDIPQKFGGSGWRAEQMLEVFRHAGRYNLNLRDVVGGAHGKPVAEMSSEIARLALEDLIEGKAYFAVAITEGEVGTDHTNIRSRAQRDGDGFRLTGSKLWNARLRQATHVVLYTRAATGRKSKLSAFLLPINHPGLRIVDRYAHGLTGNSFGGLEFENMYVGADHLIGKDADGGALFKQHFLYWRLMQGASAIGCGERALEIMADRLRERHVFGGPIARFSHLQQPIGEQLTKLRMALALSRQAAEYIDRGNYDAAEPLVNGIKAEGVEIALTACDIAMRAHGALGYSREVDLGDRVRDLMGLRIADGTTDVMRMLVVREAYGHDLWQMAVEGDKPRTSIIPPD